MIGTEVTHYRLLDRLGVGGMGEVFRAEDLRLGRHVALKFMKREFLDRPELKLRFEFEARAVALLNHPNITTVYEFDSEAGFIAFEFVEGATLEGRIMGGRLDLEEVLRLGTAICRALSHAHGRNVVHRDLKPSNILLGPEGAIKLTDFGLALVRNNPGTEDTGGVAGTVAYMSPEQINGETVDRRGDLFSLGVLLFEAVTGRLPWRGEAGLELLLSVLNDEPPPLAELRPDLPAGFAEVVERLLQKEADARFGSAEDVERSLLELELEEASRTPPAGGAAPAGRAAAGRAAPPAPAAPAPPEPGAAPFLGREAERAQFLELLAAATEGRGGALFVGGESGSGKSRLAQEFVAEARARQVLCLRGRCVLHEGRNFGPFVDALEEFARRAGAVGGRLAGAAPARAADAGVAPELLERVLPALSLLVASDGQQTLEARSREQLWHLLDSVLKEMASHTPLLISLDDLHWADEGTLSLLSHIIRNAGSSRLLVLGTYRTDELLQQADGRPHPFDDFLRASGTLPGCHRLQLAPLDVEATVQLLTAHQRSANTPPHLLRQLGTMIHRRAQGNPFFTLEIIRMLTTVEVGPDTGETTDRALLPQSITDVLMRRLLRLTAEERDMLDVAAVEGETFHSDTLQEATGLSRIIILKRLQGLYQAHRLIEPAEDGHRFTHGLIREVLLKQMDPELRREFHALVAQHLVRGYGERADYAARIGTHFLKGQRYGEAVPFFVRAAAEARRLFLNDLALEHLDKALDAEARRPGPAAARVALLAERSEVLRLLGRPEDARRAAEAAVEATGAGADPLLLGAAHEALGEAALAQGDLPAAEAALGEAFRLASGAADAPRLARSVRTLGAVAARRGDFDQALERFGEAQAAFQAAGLASAAGVARLDAADVLFRRGDYDDALAAFEAALDELRRLGDKPNIARGLKLAGNVLFLRGRRAEALARYEEALALARELKDLQAQAQLQANLGNMQLTQGNLEEAHANYAAAFERFRQIGDQFGSGQSLLALGNVEYLGGRYRTAAQYYDASLAPRRAMGDRPGLANALDNLGVMEYLLGDWTTALEHARESLDLRLALGDRPGLIESSLNLGNLQAVLGDVSGATSLYLGALNQAQEQGDRPRQVRAHLALAGLAFWRRDLERAARALTAARDLEVDDATLEIRRRLLEACLGIVSGPAGQAVGVQIADEAAVRALEIGARPEAVSCRLARCLGLMAQGKLGPGREEARQALELLSGFELPFLELHVRRVHRQTWAAPPTAEGEARLAELEARFAELAPADEGWPRAFPLP